MEMQTLQTRTQNAEEIHTAYRVEEIDIEELRQRVPEVDRVLAALDLEPDPLEVRYGRPLPVQLIRRYAMLAAWRAETERLDDGSWYAEIRGFPGVWAQGNSEREALKELESVVRDWVLLKVVDQDNDLPIIDEIDLNAL
jgi:predicted RNase H-like HicB family nuclease